FLRSLTHRPPTVPLSPYTTLFRSLVRPCQVITFNICLTPVDHCPCSYDLKARTIGCEREYKIILGKSDSVTGILNNHRHIKSRRDRKSTRLNSSHVKISYAVFCLK